LIAGTNGKGSTAATLASIVQAAGYRTGLYTSPHLVRINERIQIDREPISDVEFAIMYERVDSIARQLVKTGKLPWHPSFFEMLTAMMFEYFASADVDLAVLEVGMGGRLDATNIAHPAVTVITDIDLDHQKFLGNTLEEIAREKAGIIRPGVPVVLLPQHPRVNETLGQEILERKARPVSATSYMPPVTPQAGKYDEALHSGRNRFPLEVMGREIMIDFPLRGQHQLRNLALAVAAAEQLNQAGVRIRPQDVESGVRNTSWPGRFEILPAQADRPEMVLDVAHNPAGAWTLRSALSTSYGERPLIFVFGAMKDKEIAEIAEILFPLAEHVVLTHADSPRAATTHEIAELAAHTQANFMEEQSISAALDRAVHLAGRSCVVVITGSIYVVGAALAHLRTGIPVRQSV
jgi:dihydrofolate synthase/folylpolyglutamate synthase